MTKKFYITTPIYYLNAAPHIGHAYTTLACDVLTRYKKTYGQDAYFLTGTDEHGANIEKAAQAAGVPPQQWVDDMAAKFIQLWKDLGIQYDDLIRTTESRHTQVVQQIFETLLKKGDIYKGNYSGKYCLSCEAYLDEAELIDGKCPIHKKEPQIITEETYFFKLSAYQDKLLAFYEENPAFLSPKFRAAEIVNFVKSGLRDLSVSRTKVKWGIPVSSDPQHTIYVWFDALINYVSAAGYLSDDKKFNELWPADVHLIGKEIYRFHAVIWPAVLMALGLPLPGKVFAHGWWTVEGDKMSKSLGNIINPTDITNKYGVDALRYFVFREVPFGGDGDFSMSSFVRRYNADLANDLGNLISRTLNMAAKTVGQIPSEDLTEGSFLTSVLSKEADYTAAMDALQFDKALDVIWAAVSAMNKFIDETKPWTLAKDDPKKAAEILLQIIFALRGVNKWLKPFMPASSAEIAKRLAPGPIEKYAPLFPRLEEDKK